MDMSNLSSLAFVVCTALESARKIYQIYTMGVSAQIKSATSANKEVRCMN